jgi:hypothetical protein
MWNIQGLTEEETDEPVFKNFVNKFCIVSFVETWNDSGKSINNILSFTCICKSTRKKHQRARRGSGDIAVMSKTVYLKVYLICLVVIMILSGLNWTANSLA